MIRHRWRATVALTAVLATLVSCGSDTPSSSWLFRTPDPVAATPATPTATPAAPTPTPRPADVDLTLLDFNIEYGGDEVDFDKVIEAIRLADPDVVALEEAEGNTGRVADALGWPYVSVRSQLVSKLPLIDPPGANGEYTFVEVRPGEVVAIVNVHLPSDPYGPYHVRDGESLEAVLELERTTRLAALQPKLDAVADVLAAGIPTFVLGDFNAPSHLDWTEAAVGQRPHVLYAVAWPVSMALEAAGFRDTYRELHPDPVSHPGLTWWAGRPLVDDYPDPSEPQDRIDIIYAAGPATTVATALVGEVGGPQVEIAVDPWGSDHRAVLATFRVQPGVPGAYVSVDRPLVPAGSDITVRYRTPGDGERLAVRPAGAIDGTPLIEIALDAGVTSGMSTIGTGALAPADYEVQLLHVTGGITSRTPVRVAADGEVATIRLPSATRASGDPIEVVFTGAPGSRWDWIGLYPRGGDPNVDDYEYYTYTGSRVSGSVTVDDRGEGAWPLAPGEYDVLLLLDDGYVELARAPLTITP